MSRYAKNIHLEIVEQPSSAPMRFRYECERRTAATIFGEKTTNDNRTFPTIRVTGYTGQLTVVVSCVEMNEPYR